MDYANYVTDIENLIDWDNRNIDTNAIENILEVVHDYGYEDGESSGKEEAEKDYDMGYENGKEDGNSEAEENLIVVTNILDQTKLNLIKEKFDLITMEYLDSL